MVVFQYASHFKASKIIAMCLIEFPFTISTINALNTYDKLINANTLVYAIEQQTVCACCTYWNWSALMRRCETLHTHSSCLSSFLQLLQQLNVNIVQPVWFRVAFSVDKCIVVYLRPHTTARPPHMHHFSVGSRHSRSPSSAPTRQSKRGRKRRVHARSALRVHPPTHRCLFVQATRPYVHTLVECNYCANR